MTKLFVEDGKEITYDCLHFTVDTVSLRNTISVAPIEMFVCFRLVGAPLRSEKIIYQYEFGM